MEQVSLSRALARFVVELSYEDLPPQVAERGKTRILDTLSACFAGRDLPWSQIAAKLAENSQGSSTVFGYGTKVAAMDAALANAVMSHSVLLEDCFSGAGHPSVIIVPAAMAVAEEECLSGAELITAIVAAYEVYTRIGLGQGGRWRPRFRDVPVLGAFGAATASGKLFKLNEDQMTSALGFAANCGSGMSEGWSYGTMEPMFHAGVACRNGILVANATRMGAIAAETALEGKYGFYMAFAGGTDDTKVVTADLGKRFMIMDVLTKLYPARGYNQTAIDLCLTIREQNQIEAREIEKIVETVSRRVKNTAGGDYGGPFTTQFQAQMSAKFCVAAALLGKPINLPTLSTQHYDDPEIFETAKKVELVEDESRGKYNRRIEVFMKNGKRYVIDEDRLSKFIPTREVIEKKFMTLALDFLGKAKAEEVIDTVMNLDKLDNISKLTRSLSR